MTKKWRRTRLCALICAIAVPTASALAQSSDTTPPPQTGTTTWQKPQPSETQRVTQNPSRDSRNSFGFSVEAMGMYDNNPYGSGSLNQQDMAEVFAPSIFATLSHRKLMMHVEYQLAYRRYPDDHTLTSTTNDGGFELAYEKSKRLSFSVQDHARSGPNDFLSLSGGGTGLYSISGLMPTQQVFFDRQRIVSNSALASMSFKATRNNTFAFTTDHEQSQFSVNTVENTTTARAMASENYQVSKSWGISGEVSNQWVTSVSGIRSGRILEFLGGLNIRVSKGFSIQGRAGVEEVHSGLGPKYSSTGEASFSHTSRTNNISVSYSLRSGYQLGLAGLNRNDSVTGSFDQKLGRYVTFHLQSTYFRTIGLAYYGHLSTMASSGGFEFSVHPSVVLTLSGNYMDQRQGTTTNNAATLNASRTMLMAGVSYLFPPVKPKRGAAPVAR